jgi:predicted phosphodiesterase
MLYLNRWKSLVSLLAVVGVACGVPPGLATTWEEPEPGLFTTGPYILLGKAGQAFVAVKSTDLKEPPRVEWWVGDGARTVVAAEEYDDLWITTLEDLPVGDVISYRVRSIKGDTPPYQFRVGVEEGESFRFAAFGDTRTGHSVHRAVVEALARENIEFVLHTGDMVERGGKQSQWDLFFQIERPLLVDRPILPSIGNHDLGARQYYRRYFMHRLWARNLRYYYHDWGNLRIVAMDGGIECRDGCTQYGYVDRVLEQGAEQGKLLVMMLHFPPYSSGDHGSHLGVQEPVTQLAKRHGVELVITGHDHNYERTVEIEGTTYIVSGSAGAPIRAVRPQWFTAHARTEPHYVLIDVEGHRMTLRAVNLKGEVFDTHIIEPNPPQP